MKVSIFSVSVAFGVIKTHFFVLKCGFVIL